MIYKNTSFIIEDGMVDFLGHIALDFDRLVATFRTWWSFVRQFKVNNQLLVSNDTRTGLDDSMQSISRPKVLQMVMILS